MAFKAAVVTPVEHPAFTTAAAPTSPIDLADGATEAVPVQAALAQAPPSPAIKEGCGLGLGNPDPDISGSVRQHAQPMGVNLKKPRATATVDDLAFFMLAAVFLFGLSALVY